MTASYDIAIVGCGPVGAYAANLCGRHGLRTVVLEREADAYPLPRAVHLDHEMMRLFADVGLLDVMTPLMFATDGHVHIGADGGVIRFLSSPGTSRPFGFSNDYFFYQPELEAALRDGIGRFPAVTLRSGETVVAVTPADRDVTLSLSGGETISARYVIGCDGARSTVRKSLDIPLDDLGFEEPWLVVDAEVDGPICFPGFKGVPEGADLQRLSVMLCDPGRPTTVVPGRGNHRRWEFMLLPGEVDEAMMAPEIVDGLVAPWVEGVAHRIVRAATYRFHGLVAERWRQQRAFLAGDAAHQTPPFFGQGMCHGLRDVANLVWKLALVVQGKAEDDVLDTYQLERDPHVRGVIGAAVDAGRYICELDPDLAAARDANLRTQSGPRTAADLIPAIAAGIVEGDAGERFIQPRVTTALGISAPLDVATGGGWVMLTRGVLPAVGTNARHVWDMIGGRTFAVGPDISDDADILDEEGHLEAWFERHGAIAAIVRPDFYTYAAPADMPALITAIERLSTHLCLRTAIGAEG